MNLSQAQLEFVIRLYRWARLRGVEEVRDEFTHFWLFKGGLTWKTYQFMRQLSGRDLDLFVAALLKRSHREGVAGLGEWMSVDENAMLERSYAFRAFSPFEKELAARKRLGEKIRFASKRSVQRAVISRFEQAFGHMGLEGLEKADTEGANLRTKFREWIVQTNFFFGRSQSLIRFDHFVSHPVLFSSPGAIKYPYLATNICWINLGVMEWNFLTDSDIEPACDSVIELCREFFDKLPELLEGLEVENVTLG